MVPSRKRQKDHYGYPKATYMHWRKLSVLYHPKNVPCLFLADENKNFLQHSNKSVLQFETHRHRESRQNRHTQSTSYTKTPAKNFYCLLFCNYSLLMVHQC